MIYNEYIKRKMMLEYYEVATGVGNENQCNNWRTNICCDVRG